MHPLHDYVAKQLADKLKDRRVVVWYDERAEFQAFVNELRRPNNSSEAVSVLIGSTKAVLVEYTGSMFELRATVEPHVRGDKPDFVVVYLPGVGHDPKTSVLMELEKGGTSWKPALKQLAKNVLLQKYTQGVVDQMLPFDRKVSYDDLAYAAAGNSPSDPPSILKSIFHETSGKDGLLATWLVNEGKDHEIVDKGATAELTKLVKARVGLELQPHVPLTKMRAITLRYVLAGEFRLDLLCDPPACLQGVPAPSSKYEESALRGLATNLRTNFPATYAKLADRVEDELGLRNSAVPPGALGSIDTFRFEEQALLRHTGDLISNKKFEEALAIVSQREQSFWLDRDVSRKAQWEAAKLMAELGSLGLEMQGAINKLSGGPVAWLNSYVSEDGWFRLDQAQRRLEAWVANLDDEPEERPLGVVRRIYEDACHMMADGFTKALVKDGWNVPGALHQTHIWSEFVEDRPKPVAYFLVDAMRFEMGLELAGRLPKTAEVFVRPALGVLPSITPIGMSALLPGASMSFSVVEQSDKLGARIDDSFLPDLASRKKFTASRVPNFVDVTLDEILSLQPSKLAKKLDGKQVIVVRSQEIDHAGETGFTFQARQVMDTVIDNLARAIRKLAATGIEHAVVSADHGHLFFANDREECMRTDAPGGDTVELHRRCWIGRGGFTPPGCVRVSASSLGYVSDLDFVFPSGTGVFKAGGDLAYHHGGCSLQEIVVPVLTVRTKIGHSARHSSTLVVAWSLPEAITNRIFSVTFELAEKQMMLEATGLQIRPFLTAAGKQVGAVGMAVDAEFDRSTGCVKIEQAKPVTVAFMLSDESVSSLRVVVQDPTTDAELYRSPKDIPVRLGV